MRRTRSRSSRTSSRFRSWQSGGSFDQAALDLYVALAQADVDTLKAAQQGSYGGQLQAQLGGAQAELREAEYRIQQAQGGQGGVGARPKDIAQGAADVKSAEANLGLLLHPLTEYVEQAQ